MFGILAFPIPLIYHFLIGEKISPFDLLVCVSFYLFLFITDWGSNLFVKVKKAFKEKVHRTNEERVNKILNKVANKAIFNRWFHMIALLCVSCFVAVTILLTNYLIPLNDNPDIQNHALLYFWKPSVFYPIITISYGVCFFLGGCYTFHVINTQIIDKLHPLNALDNDRMGGYGFIGDAMFGFIWRVSILVVSLVSILSILTLGSIFWTELYYIDIPVVLVLLIIGVVVLGFYYIINDLHERLVKEKERVLSEIPLIHHLGAEGQIGPLSLIFLSINTITDKVHNMLEWPINSEEGIAIGIGVFTSLILVSLRFVGYPV